jgi:GNAT superfamily N-acetyltransferase
MFLPRLATPPDYPAFAHLFPELGVPDPVPTAADFEGRMLPRVVILEGTDGPIGYAFWRLYGKTAHVVHVVVDARARRQGAGRALLEDVRARVRAEGCSRWYLNVKQDNGAAIALYERCGFAIEAESWTVRATWADLDALPDPRASAAAYSPPHGEDSALAARFDIEPERLALLRKRPEIVLSALREESALVAFAAFDPRFPGVYPLRVARHELVRPLLDALRPHASHSYTHLSVEHDRALFDLLSNAGATLVHALYRMTGAV